jgi:hypothetical protein
VCFASRAILDETLSCLFRTANIGLEDWMKVNSFMCKTLHVPLFDYVQILRLSGVNYQCIPYPDLERNHQEDINVAAHSNSVHCQLLTKCVNIHTLTITFRAPSWIGGNNHHAQYRGYPIDDFLKGFDLQVVLALKHLRKVTIAGVAWRGIR